jgi:hypothetical protein
MRHLATITIGAAMLVAVSSGPRTSADIVAPEVAQTAHHKPLPRCPGFRKQKTRKGHAAAGRCIGVGTGGGTLTGNGTVSRTVIVPAPAPTIVTFGNGAGNGVTTFGSGPGPGPTTGTGPFGNLRGANGGR